MKRVLISLLLLVAVTVHAGELPIEEVIIAEQAQAVMYGMIQSIPLVNAP